MKPLEINGISDQVVLFMRQQAYNELLLAERLDISPQTISRRISTDVWMFDDLRRLERVFESRGCVLVREVIIKVKINRR